VPSLQKKSTDVVASSRCLAALGFVTIEAARNPKFDLPPPLTLTRNDHEQLYVRLFTLFPPEDIGVFSFLSWGCKPSSPAAHRKACSNFPSVEPLIPNDLPSFHATGLVLSREPRFQLVSHSDVFCRKLFLAPQPHSICRPDFPPINHFLFASAPLSRRPYVRPGFQSFCITSFWRRLQHCPFFRLSRPPFLTFRLRNPVSCLLSPF